MNKLSRIVPPVYFLIAILTMVGLHYVLPLARWLSPPLTYAGALLIAVGIGMAAWGSRAFANAGTPVRPFEASTRMVTHGLFRYTRNPMYLGMIAILAGTGLLLGTLMPLALIPLFVYLIQTLFVLPEEKMLEATFGEEYRQYLARVRRWI